MVRLRGEYLASHDNFTHWATVVKTMLITNKLPTQNDAFVDFSTYPLGSSLWIYFISRIIKDSESIYMFAKELITLSALTSLVSFIKKAEPVKIIALILFGILVSTSIINVASLLVDNLLPLVALASLSILLKCKEQPLASIPVLIMLCQIKASGIVFCVMIVLIFLLKNKEKNKAKSIFLYLIIPIISIIVWRLHVNVAFIDANASNHSVSLEYIKNIIYNKNISDFFDIVALAFKKIGILNIDNKYGLYTPILLVILSYLSFEKKEEKLHLSITIVSLYLIYFVLVLIMYMFSMPLVEAKVLSSFERYMNSIAILLIGFYIIGYLQTDISKTYKKVIPIIIVILLTLSSNSYTLITPNSTKNCKRVKFAKALNEAGVKRGGNYLIIDNEGSDKERTFSYWSRRYDLWTENIYVVSEPKEIEEALFEWEKWFNYLIIDTPTDESNYYLQQNNLMDFYNEPFVVLKSNLKE